MIEKLYKYALDDVSVVEKLVDTKHVSIAHAIVKSGEAFPAHPADADVNIIIVKGQLTIIANKQDAHEYKKGDIIAIPINTELTLSNNGQDDNPFDIIRIEIWTRLHTARSSPTSPS